MSIFTFSVRAEAKVEADCPKKALEKIRKDHPDAKLINCDGPRPEKWKIGDKVMIVAEQGEWGPGLGCRGHLTDVREDQGVVWMKPDDGFGVYWTNPRDIILIEEGDSSKKKE